MQYPDLGAYLEKGGAAQDRGAVAVLMMEDLAETNSTIRHHLARGFGHVVVAGPAALAISPELRKRVHHVIADVHAGGGAAHLVNAVAATATGRWVYYGFNAEYLFYPFSESRSIGEMTAFVTEERRESVLCYVIDLYAGDLGAHPDGVSPESALLDRCGYYAHGRSRGDEVMERQLDMFGGLRWRYEEHVPEDRRRIDRIALFRARKGLELREDFLLNDEELNTYSSPWHHSLTAAVCSFRAAKSLRTNAGSRGEIDSFLWHNSEPFGWHSRQLMELGLMEPGQWF